MSGSSTGMHIQVELPTPTHHQPPWSQNGLHPYAQMNHSPFVQNGRLAWNHSSDLVAITKPSLADFVPTQTNPTGICHHNHFDGSINNLDDSDTTHDRPDSPASSLTDVCSDFGLGARGDDNDNDNDGDGDSHRNEVGGSTVSRITGYGGLDGYAVPPSLTRPTTIRFYSRVRITSGLHRHRLSTNTSMVNAETGNSPLLTASNGSYYHLTPSSSLSGSPSSSISAPLHSRTDDEADRPGWGPLGRRVSMFAKQSRTRNGRVDDLPVPQPRMTETSPLLVPLPRRRMHPHGQRRRRRKCYCSECGTSSRKLSPEQVDEVFGKWPNRMLNYQWWWWSAEGILCCRCLDETDDESH